MNILRRQSKHCRYTIKLFFLVGVGFLGSLLSASAQLVYADSFSYPDGLIVGAPGSPWVNNYEPSNQASVVSGRLVLTESKQESIRVDLPYTASGALYARMIVNFSALPEGPRGNFFAFFRVISADNLRCRIWASTNGAAPGRFRLGITTIFFPPVMIAHDLFIGTNYTLVSRYDVLSNHSTLWINPADESDTTLRADDFTSVDQTGIGHFGFLQTAFYDTNSVNRIGTLTVDDLRLGRSFAEVLPLVKFISITNAANGTVALRAVGQATTNYILQANTNLTATNWAAINIGTATTNGFLDFQDSAAPAFPRRFYRLLKQ